MVLKFTNRVDMKKMITGRHMKTEDSNKIAKLGKVWLLQDLPIWWRKWNKMNKDLALTEKLLSLKLMAKLSPLPRWLLMNYSQNIWIWQWKRSIDGSCWLFVVCSYLLIITAMIFRHLLRLWLNKSLEQRNLLLDWSTLCMEYQTPLFLCLVVLFLIRLVHELL